MIKPAISIVAIAFIARAASAQVDVRDANGQHVHIGPGGVTVDDAHGRTSITSSGGRTSIRQHGSASAAYAGSGGRAAVGCAGGRLEVSGSRKVLHVAGPCSHVELSGSFNTVYVTLAPGADVELTGTRNRLIWRPADPRGRSPHVEFTGTGNSFTRG